MLIAALLLRAANLAQASVTLLLEQPYGGMGAINPTGHSAIYLDHVCAETPLHLRPCRPGELGAVISRYDDIAGYDWIAIPLLPYLYAVERPEEIPASVDVVEVSQLRNLYRRAHLDAIAPDDEEGNAPPGNWYELIGSAFDRTIYGFEVNSTPEQDNRIIALLNDRKNVERYNGAFRNCADFARVTLNRFYPHAIRRNLIADLGLSTPKSVARGLTRYGSKHPEIGLQVFVIPQVKGSLPRSHHAQGVTESLLTRYGVPLTLLSPVATGLVFVAYLGHGRFEMPRNAPVLDLSAAVPGPNAPAGPRRTLLLPNTAEATAFPIALPVDLERATTPPSASSVEKGEGAASIFEAPASFTAPAPGFSLPVMNLPLFP